MPREPVLHFNPKETVGRTKCGRRLSKIKRWTEDPNDVTCNLCLRKIAGSYIKN